MVALLVVPRRSSWSAMNCRTSSGCSSPTRPAGQRTSQQQPLDDSAAAATRSGGQAPRVAHVGVVAAQLIGDGPSAAGVRR